MKKMLKKWICSLIALILICSAVPEGLISDVAYASATNPSFTVEYYAEIEQLATSGANSIDVLDTSGAKLPTNANVRTGSGSISSRKIYLNADGTIAMKLSEQQIYKNIEFSYIEAPSVFHVDKVSHIEGNYTIKEIRVKQGSGSWTTYSNPSLVNFTNNAANAGGNTIHITDNTTIRLVYSETGEDVPVDTDFFDYDITDGTTEKVGDKTIWKTAHYGINSASNYGSGYKLAFGNRNTNVDWCDVAVNGYYINRANTSGTAATNVSFSKNCSFGITAGITGDRTLKYANGITAPDLFSQKAVTGKNIILGDNSMVFARTGDNYVLSYTSVQGKNTQTNLNRLVYEAGAWNNNFWPLDLSDGVNIPGKKDPDFGLPNGQEPNCYRDDNDYIYGLPQSDDSKIHNSYFGLAFDVAFTLDSEYVGPMNYLFFGDDDMWVYLVKKNGSSWDYANAKLVCDIGGVHSAVGEYVNLWDYISGGKNNHATADYKLAFFYVERGASGSNCFMQFTLPQVHPLQPRDPRGTLEITKAVSAADAIGGYADQEFSFTVDLEGEKVKNGDIFSCLIYEAGATNYSEARSFVFSKSNIPFELILKRGERAVIENLPEGTIYTVTETASGNFNPSQETFTGTIGNGVTAAAAFSNVLKKGNLTVSKTAAGDYDGSESFSFTVRLSNTAVNGTFGDMTFNNGVATFTLSGGQSKTATGLPAGEIYTVTEAKPSGDVVTTINGYSAATDGDGNPLIGGVITENQTQSAAFTNHKRRAAEVTINGKKTLTGGTLSAGQFTFKLYDSEGNVVDTQTNAADGSFTFKKLEFGAAGTYTYTVKESKGSAGNIVYDENEYTVTVSVSLTPDGKDYTATVTYPSGGSVSFENKQVVNVTVNKAWVDNNWASRPESISVTLYDGGAVANVANNPATLSASTGWSHTWTNLLATGNYTVRESIAYDTANPDKLGNYKPVVTGPNRSGNYIEYTITNTLNMGGLTVSKAVSGGYAGSDKSFDFTVTLSDTTISGTFGDMTFANGVATFELKGDESMTATGLPAGLTYSVTEASTGDDSVTESTGETGTIPAGRNAQASFTNHKRRAAEVTINGKKTLAGGTLSAGQFTFKLYDSEGNVVDTQTNAADGSFTFKKLEFGAAGTYTYTVKESKGSAGNIVYDENEYTVTVNVSLTPDGKDYTATVTYPSGGSVSFENKQVVKVTVNKQWVDSDWAGRPEIVEMTLYDGDDKYEAEGVQNPVVLSDITGWSYTWENLLATGNYTVLESIEYDAENPDKPGNYTGSVQQSTVGNEIIYTFTNTLNMGGLSVEKEVLAVEWVQQERDFYFTVTLSDSTINGVYGNTPWYSLTETPTVEEGGMYPIIVQPEGMKFVDGVATFKLKHGEKVLATGLPAGVTFTVEERQYKGYDTFVGMNGGELVPGTVAEGTITSQGDAVTSVQYRNASQIPDAGDHSRPVLWLAMMLGALACLLAMKRTSRA